MILSRWGDTTFVTIVASLASHFPDFWSRICQIWGRARQCVFYGKLKKETCNWCKWCQSQQFTLKLTVCGKMFDGSADAADDRRHGGNIGFAITSDCSPIRYLASPVLQYAFSLNWWCKWNIFDLIPELEFKEQAQCYKRANVGRRLILDHIWIRQWIIQGNQVLFGLLHCSNWNPDTSQSRYKTNVSTQSHPPKARQPHMFWWRIDASTHAMRNIHDIYIWTAIDHIYFVFMFLFACCSYLINRNYAWQWK